MDDEGFSKVAETVACSLSSLGYPNPINAHELMKWVSDIDSFLPYSQCIGWLATELRTQCKLDESIGPVSDLEDFDQFRTEFNSFLREIYCPYSVLQDYRSNDNPSWPFHRLELLSFLCTELQAARVSKRVKREESITSESPSPSVILEKSAEVLGLKERVSENCSRKEDILKVIIEEVKSRLKTIPPSILDEPLLTEDLNENQWSALEILNDQMKGDYQSRAEMLLKRLDVTIQSFSWSDRLKGRKQEILAVYNPLRQQLSARSQISTADLLAARQDLTSVEKSGNSKLSTRSKLHKLMLSVGPPDRGGRPKDVTRMPQWKERIVSGGGGPERERHHRKKKGLKEKRKSKDEETSSGPSGTATMAKKSRKKSKKGSDADGIEVHDANELVD